MSPYCLRALSLGFARPPQRRWQTLADTTLPQHRSMASFQIKQKPDVIVIGSGIAGLSASIAAAEKGASVLLLERFHGEGTTALSGGIVYASGRTQQQKEAGYDDTPGSMFAYLRQEIGDVVKEKTLKRFCDESPGVIKWLEKHGARFKGALSPYKTSYPNTQHYLYFSGSEKAYPYSSLAKPAPRGHRMVYDGFSGAGIAKALLDGARQLGVQIVPASKVEKILLAKDGSVRGVEYLTRANSSSKLAKHEKLTRQALNSSQVPPVLKMQRYHWLYWDHKKARSLENLAKKFGISPQGLRQTVDAYSDAIKNDKPDPAKKMPNTRSPILKPLFYGIDIFIKLTKGLQQVVRLSLGGLRVEEESGLVLDEAGKTIKGLYAAGRNAVGICSSTYVSGLSLGDGVFLGRRAGVHAVGNVKTTS